MNLLSWVLLSMIIAANIIVVLMALYIDSIRNNHAENIPLSIYTPERLMEECSKDFHNPRIIWP